MVPITQDASASAYQIVLYLLLNEELAMRTNLIKSPDKKRNSIYTDIKSSSMNILKKN
jgi:hypothetical protein